MEVLLEKFIIYSIVFLLTIMVVYIYVRKNKRQTKVNREKINKAKELGFYEPVSLHPLVNLDICLGSGACVAACPEFDVLGLIDGKAATINASRCVGHGACFHACPVGAISLVMGTEKRGVDLPHVSAEFETNAKGIYIAGELGGMGLIKNAVEQGRQSIENIKKNFTRSQNATYDVVIIGAGPAGISASLAALEKNLRFITLDQDSLGGTVYTFPRKKVIMTAPMHLPLYGKVSKTEFTKNELLNLWKDVLQKNKIEINENTKVLSVEKNSDHIIVKTENKSMSTNFVLLAIGRRGSPRKLGVDGEMSEKVSYRLIEPEHIRDKHVLVVGGGDSAIEAALALAEENNKVIISYRGESFSRVKPKNFDNISKAASAKRIEIVFQSVVKEIKDELVVLGTERNGMQVEREILNDLVYVFVGGELPNEFLQKAGIRITKKFGEVVLKHRD
jgi:thioredoxin reductase/Pyruvate/2-oxoacid:ferredoxin oxidoreductase delta subunit